jgi:GGDEF domain-containing protein
LASSLLWPAALLLSLLFGNSRLFFPTLIAGLTWLSYQTQMTTAFLPAPALPVILLFPPLLTAAHLVSGRGVITQGSLSGWITALLFVFFYLLWAQGPPEFAGALTSSLLRSRVLLEPLPLSVAEILYLSAAVTLVARALLGDSVTEGASLGYLSAGYLAYQELIPADTGLAWALAPLVAGAGILMETYALAYVDTLTRLPGRRAMERYAKQLGREYAVAMIDIDHFKQFNDTHGHHVGDQVLRMVAGRLREVSAGGKVFRYGGEEFTVFFDHNDKGVITRELERLRSLVGDKPFVLRGSSRPPERKGKKQRGWGSNRQKATVTISVGVAFATPEERKVENVRKRADEALYTAKKKGRNRVVPV